MMQEPGIPTVTWAVLTIQDSDGKVSVMEIPTGNSGVPLVVLRSHG